MVFFPVALHPYSPIVLLFPPKTEISLVIGFDFKLGLNVNLMFSHDWNPLLRIYDSFDFLTNISIGAGAIFGWGSKAF